MEAKFFRFLKVVGVGFKARAEAEGRLLYLKVGFTHEIELTVPPAVRVFCFKPNVICCTGLDKRRVHQFAAAVRDCKPPDVYKGKGILFRNAIVASGLIAFAAAGLAFPFLLASSKNKPVIDPTKPLPPQATFRGPYINTGSRDIGPDNGSDSERKS
ncbi:hypothetical protein H6P81_015220 [Aristolochia fimbriata]|uniref:Large ribosomal subunit protein uL6 alpha-beta domain-containing protein n=1 Tax=Aristolochia fimbriata TaxID=158543 RepID=A0AAV7E4P8_ARIFI|nr:hypothetical protein H6P81_015220 [Aristolochia fimbriata]